MRLDLYTPIFGPIELVQPCLEKIRTGDARQRVIDLGRIDNGRIRAYFLEELDDDRGRATGG
jgi:hypothetical protein